jgi:Zn2+/Cd2+-exporting ATPase
MDCASCATKIENALQRMLGISDVVVSVPAGTVTVTHDGAKADDKIRKQISDLGYQVAGKEDIGIKRPRHDQGERASDDGADPSNHERIAVGSAWWQTRKGMLTIASGLALAVAYLLGKLIPATEHWAFLLAMLVSLLPIGRRAISAARAGTPFSIEMPMSIAALGAVIIGATEEAATVVFLFLIGELLEGVAANRARTSIQDLTKLVPKTACLEESGLVREVPADSLSAGSTIQIRPGDRIPADGGHPFRRERNR